MSTTIPFDPSLVLGNIVPQGHLQNLEQISALQSPIDAALQELNSAILLKRKLTMVARDMFNMSVDASKVSAAIKKVDTEISSAAANYSNISVDALPNIAALRGKIPQVSDSVESPIDYNRSEIKKFPLSADSLTLDCQYFSFEEEKQDSQSQMGSLQAYVSEKTSFLGDHFSSQATQAVQEQVSSQRERHDIVGTLVITANCTHKNASIFAPFMIDVDKGIRAWNEIFKDNADKIKTNSPASIEKIAAEQQTDKAKYFNLISGVTYGSYTESILHPILPDDVFHGGKPANTNENRGMVRRYRRWIRRLQYVFRQREKSAQPTVDFIPCQPGGDGSDPDSQSQCGSRRG
jgi:hypothetical protein